MNHQVDFTKQLDKVLSILNEMGSIAKIGGWELDVSSGELTWTDETFRILEVEKRKNQKPNLPEGLELFTDEYKPIMKEAVERAMTLGEPYSLEVQAKTAKGNVLWVFTNGKPNYKDGKIVSLSGTIQDIDDVKKTREKYEAERLKSIHNAKLASLGELSAGIAHEINNPLSIITGSVEVMRKYIDQPEKIKSLLENIERSSYRISRIVQSLKKFSRTDSIPEFSQYKLGRIITESILLLEARIKRADILLEKNIRNDSDILCDEVEIEQVIVNLINNSIDAIQDLPIRKIDIELNREDDWLLLKISDSGPGIPAEIRDKIFDPFFTTKEHGKGTGLGLSITRGILENHGATISIESDCATTCFLLKFPVYKGD